MLFACLRLSNCRLGVRPALRHSSTGIEDVRFSGRVLSCHFSHLLVHLNDLPLVVQLSGHSVVASTDSPDEAVALLATKEYDRPQLLGFFHLFLAAFLFNSFLLLLLQELTVGDVFRTSFLFLRGFISRGYVAALL